MTAQPPGRVTRKAAPTATDPTPRRRRDATETRQLLLDAARRRFGSDGYAATTVRDIADDAGVNVALISRYFASKEGLFEACLGAAGDELRRTTGEVPFERIAEAIAHQVAGLPTSGVPSQLTLLLRSSGDTRADEIRLGVLHQSGERLAAAAGWRPDEPDSDRLLLQAQMVLAATIGLAVLRTTSTPLQPLASATEQDLVEPLRALVDALLPGR
ncbi:TetR family transcriptional regulator [Micromonospora sp. NPDC004704]